jgi:hypothetical protein
VASVTASLREILPALKDADPSQRAEVFSVISDEFFGACFDSGVNVSANAAEAEEKTLLLASRAYEAMCDDHRGRNAQRTIIAKSSKFLARTQTHRAAIQAPADALKSLVKIKEQAEREKKLKRLGLNIHDFLDYDVSTPVAILSSFQIVTKMLVVVVLLSTVVFSFILSMAELLKDHTLQKSGEAQYGANNQTLTELLDQSDFDDVLAEDRREIAVTFSLLWTAGAMWLTSSACVIFNASVNGWGTFLRLALPGVVSMLGIWAYYALGGSGINGSGAIFVAVLSSSFCIVLMVLELVDNKESESGAYLVALAGSRAANLLLDDGTTAVAKLSFRKRLRIGLKSVIPSMFTICILMLYVTVVFALFGLFDNSAWKVAVTVLALAIKVVGNKCVVVLLSTGSMPAWTADFQLFNYEFTTAILLRVLQLSIPDASTAQLVALLSAFVEVCVRVYFLNLYLLIGLKKEFKFMTDEEKYKYAVRGKMRVSDGTNDMIVEYLSSFTAAMFIIYLAPTGAFSFATADVIQTNTVLVLCMYQLLPELVLDLYVTFMEVQAGLRPIHERGWNMTAGSDQGSKFAALRWADVVKSTVMKAAVATALTGFVLIATVI